jgi:hypothetical protein
MFAFGLYSEFCEQIKKGGRIRTAVEGMPGSVLNGSPHVKMSL